MNFVYKIEILNIIVTIMLHMEQISYKIIGQLQNKKSHVRELAKKLNITHMTISRKLNELEKENVVDYTKEGKNKVYFLKNSMEALITLKILENNKLIQLINKHPRIRRITKEIQKITSELTILFGSYAKEYETKNSDIDIYKFYKQ